MKDFLIELGIQEVNAGTSTGQEFFHKGAAPKLISHTPGDGSEIAEVHETTRDEFDAVVNRSLEAYETWRMMPAPKRGEIVRQIGEELRKYKEPLGKLIG